MPGTLVLIVMLARTQDTASVIPLCHTALEARDADRAVRLGERAARLFPDSATAHVCLGRAYIQKLEHASFLSAGSIAGKARAQFDRAIALDSMNYDAREARARYYLNAPGIAGGSKDKARADAEVARRINPYRGALLLSDIATKDKRIADAEAQLGTLARAYPDSSAPFHRLVGLYQAANRFADAFALIDARAARMPGDVASLYQLGKTAALSGEQLDRGEAALRAYLTAGHFDVAPEAFAHYRLGVILELRKDLSGALAEYQAAARLDPSIEDAAARAKRLGAR